MESVKKTAPPTKGGDGLSKKERRAQKVLAKQQTQGTTVTTTKLETKTLTEKELRKLEWEKKLAAEKAQAGDKPADNLKKAELKAKRREQQEAQRSAKIQSVEAKDVSKQEKDKPVEKETRKLISTVKKPVDKKIKVPDLRRLQIVNHLYSDVSFGNTIVNYNNVHPSFVRLGVQYSTKRILGSNARCLALLAAVKSLIVDLQTPPNQEFCRYLEQVLQHCVAYLQTCRPIAVSMSNALRHFKTELRKTTNEKKETLLDIIDTYIHEEINKAGEAISLKVNEKISNGDVILTYGCSSLVKKILHDAHKEGKQFQAIVVDGRPLLEGRQMLQRLAQIGIDCSYVQINAISYVMSSVSKVLLGAHALLTNGYVMSRIGTAQIALMAQAYNKPVLVCCETYKFSEQVLTDSFVHNELGDGEILKFVDTLPEKGPLAQMRTDANLQILNLLYDVTPPDLITAVVTELAILPCTSAPVVLRIKP